MSGGHFNDCGYIYHQVDDFAYELQRDIERNNVPDEYDYAPRLSPAVVTRLCAYVSEMQRLAEVMRHIDFLYSSDHGEETFLRLLDETEAKFNAAPTESR